MKLYSIRGGTREELGNRKYNIGVSISLGNKWFNKDNIVALVRWALQYTRERVIVYVADSIHALNIEARGHRSTARSKRIALRQGTQILNTVRDEIERSFSEAEQQKVDYIHWDELADDTYREKTDHLYHLFESNENFKNSILDLVKNHVAGEARTFSQEAIIKMAQYILEELPEVMARVKIGTVKYDAYVYPFDGELTQFVEKLQTGAFFPEVKQNILDTEPRVFLEVR